MKAIKSTQAMFPSFSGAYRVKIVFVDNTERHFYMMPDGSLFIPPNHKDTGMLLDTKRANKEWNWAVETWPKNNTGARLVTDFNKDVYLRIVALCEKFEIPNYYSRRLQEKLEKEANRPMLKNAFEDKFKQIRRNINDELHGKQNIPPVEQQVENQTAETQPKAQQSKDGSQLNKFLNKFGTNWRPRCKQASDQ